MEGETQSGGEGRGAEFSASDRWLERARHLGLDPSQRQAAQFICLGYSDDEIANRLSIPLDAIGPHFQTLFDKLEVQDRLGVISCLLLGE